MRAKSCFRPHRLCSIAMGPITTYLPQPRTNACARACVHMNRSWTVQITQRKEFLLYPPLKKNADYKKKTVFLCLYFMLSYYIMCFLDLQFTYMYISTDFISSQQNPPLTWLGLELGTLDVQSERSTNSPSEGELTASVLMIIIKVKAPIWSLVSFNSR